MPYFDMEAYKASLEPKKTPIAKKVVAKAPAVASEEVLPSEQEVSSAIDQGRNEIGEWTERDQFNRDAQALTAGQPKEAGLEYDFFGVPGLAGGVGATLVSRATGVSRLADEAGSFIGKAIKGINASKKELPKAKAFAPAEVKAGLNNAVKRLETAKGGELYAMSLKPLEREKLFEEAREINKLRLASDNAARKLGIEVPKKTPLVPESEEILKASVDKAQKNLNRFVKLNSEYIAKSPIRKEDVIGKVVSTGVPLAAKAGIFAAGDKLGQEAHAKMKDAIKDNVIVINGLR